MILETCGRDEVNLAKPTVVHHKTRMSMHLPFMPGVQAEPTGTHMKIAIIVSSSAWQKRNPIRHLFKIKRCVFGRRRMYKTANDILAVAMAQLKVQEKTTLS
jgi:hypothetical protein